MDIKSEYGFICKKEAYGCDHCLLYKWAIENDFYEDKRFKCEESFTKFRKAGGAKKYTCNDLIKLYFNSEIIPNSKYQKLYRSEYTRSYQSQTTVKCQSTDGSYRNCNECSAYEYALLLGYKPYKTTTGYKLFCNGSDIKSCDKILEEGCGMHISPPVSDDCITFNKMRNQIIDITSRLKSDYKNKHKENIEKQKIEEKEKRIRQQKEKEEKDRLELLAQLKENAKIAEENRKLREEQDWFDVRKEYIYDPDNCTLYHSILDAPVCCRKCSACDIAKIYRSHDYNWSDKRLYKNCQFLARCYVKEIVSVFGMYCLADVIDFSSPDHGGIKYQDSDEDIIKLMKSIFAVKKE